MTLQPDPSPVSPLADRDRSAAAGRRILIGVTGGIAAYKTATVVSRLAQAGAHVTVLMTEAATRFVSALTFQALSANHVHTSTWEHLSSQDPQHISLAASTELALIAPCSMDCLSRLAHGRGDDVVSLVVSAINRRATPVLLAPAMNAVMWNQPATQRNVRQLVEDGFHMIGPDDGWQACRMVGAGRMSEPEDIMSRIMTLLGDRPRV